MVSKTYNLEEWMQLTLHVTTRPRKDPLQLGPQPGREEDFEMDLSRKEVSEEQLIGAIKAYSNFQGHSPISEIERMIFHFKGQGGIHSIHLTYADTIAYLSAFFLPTS